MSVDEMTPGDGSGGEAESSDLLKGVVGDRCANCQAPLASDQRYCLGCGQRRGKPRFPVGSVTAYAAPAETDKPPRSGPRVSPNATLVAGLATLLLALGVGVLIGKGNGGNPKNAAGVQVLTVGGGGAGGSANTADPTAAAKAHKGKAVKPTVVHLSTKVKAAANNAAGKVLGTSNNLTKDPTVQVGQSCSGGAGCEGGKFTGNFFPGG